MFHCNFLFNLFAALGNIRLGSNQSHASQAHEHHVPIQEQKQHTRSFREYEAQNPRPSIEALVNRAETAIALPYGYLMDDWVMDVGALWRNEEHLGLDVENQSGVTYREVLRAAMVQVVDRLKSGEVFDLVYWGGGERIQGYQRVIQVLENSTIRECESC